MSCLPRLYRLFGPDGKCLNVAMDHGYFNEPTFLAGIERMPEAVFTISEARPDAIQLPLGSARIYQSIPDPKKPALVLRTDTANVYGRVLPRTLYSTVIPNAVEQALRLDVACVVANLLQLPEQPELLGQCIENVMALRAQCDSAGMPLMVEPLVMQNNSTAGGYMVDGDFVRIRSLVRLAAELGADIIKADPTDDVSLYHGVIEVAGEVPVLVRGGGRVSDAEILQRTEALMRQGARGVVYGRNIIQHPNPAGMTAALMAVIHRGTPAAEAETLAKSK